TNRPDVHMRFITFKLLLCHGFGTLCCWAALRRPKRHAGQIRSLGRKIKRGLPSIARIASFSNVAP
ncbi:hypothetical protein, partial [Roseinatronobacter sp.]|uniref:hypothetical protein n=1 Tax=Roseinatronobacter sp. TaxID=1945755 RepID=UPI0025EAD2CA